MSPFTPEADVSFLRQEQNCTNGARYTRRRSDVKREAQIETPNDARADAGEPGVVSAEGLTFGQGWVL